MGEDSLDDERKTCVQNINLDDGTCQIHPRECQMSKGTKQTSYYFDLRLAPRWP